MLPFPFYSLQKISKKDGRSYIFHQTILCVSYNIALNKKSTQLDLFIFGSVPRALNQIGVLNQILVEH